ncbi:MAG: Hsp20/alpha crystallin family protein [Ignavibacteriales bacterium]|nr:Hsp20/alpha crystallin family protein [Ignavibacteriales bacterium]
MIVRVQSMPALFNEVFGASQIFDQMFPRSYRAGARASEYPYVNVAEYKDEVLVVAEVPGVPKENIKLQLHDGTLTISGERKTPSGENGTWLRNEISYGSFSRTIELPDHVNIDKVSAEYSNGILRITLPKSEEAKPREISIR